MKKINEGLNKFSEGNYRAKRKKQGLSLLSILLLIFFVQLAYSIVMNSVKYVSLRGKINKLESIDKVATQKNILLREELEKYNSSKGVESLARNRLKLTQDGEMLVIIKNHNEEE
ncbi:MAG: septum formation initiator family protein [Candidatus Gastranaerophilales bacterium]|nr:septum formation initiator family protein [Candidatus Gastranaerophilales bacterium]